MDEPIALDSSEDAFLSAILRDFSNTARHPISLNGLIQRWARLVNEVETGYQDSVYDYVNDVAARDLLKRIEVEAPRRLGEHLTACLAPLDQRFLEATQPIQRALPGSSDSPWHIRVPKTMGSEVLEDLRIMGILP